VRPFLGSDAAKISVAHEIAHRDDEKLAKFRPTWSKYSNMNPMTLDQIQLFLAVVDEGASPRRRLG
jgi:hypothetical protein